MPVVVRRVLSDHTFANDQTMMPEEIMKMILDEAFYIHKAMGPRMPKRFTRIAQSTIHRCYFTTNITSKSADPLCPLWSVVFLVTILSPKTIQDAGTNNKTILDEALYP